jgi:hypothetical protein
MKGLGYIQYDPQAGLGAVPFEAAEGHRLRD